MLSSRKTAPIIKTTAFALIALAAPAVHAQNTVINSGTYTNNYTGPSGNVTVNGGTFIGRVNDSTGFTCGPNSVNTFNGGDFSGGSFNDFGVSVGYGSTATFNGGLFTPTGVGITATNTAITIKGGTFRSQNDFNNDAFVVDNNGSITVYGTNLEFFDGNNQPLPGVTTYYLNNGYVGGTLENNTQSTHLPFQIVNNGTVKLVNLAAVPETSTRISFGLLALGLSTLFLRARFRASHSPA